MSQDSVSKSELTELAEAWREARDIERARWAELLQGIARAARAGATERQLVHETGVSRVTVRKAMGKDGGSAAVDGAALKGLKSASQRSSSV